MTSIILPILIIGIFILPIILIIYYISKIKHQKNYEKRKENEEKINEQNEKYLNNLSKNLDNNKANLEIPTIETPNNQGNYDYQYKEVKQEHIQEKVCPYERKLLLTKNEWYFYKKLKKITDKYNLHILSKVRMEDVIKVKEGFTYSETQSARGRIKSRHIDF